MKATINVLAQIPTLTMDSGKYNSRFFDGTGEVDIFRTKMEKIESATPKMTTMTYNNNTYLIGNDASEIDLDPSKETLTHKLCIYYGLIRNGYANRKINLAIGTPIKYFKDPKSKQSYADFIREDGEVTVFYNNEEYKILINDVLVLPESSGILYNGDKNYEDLTSRYVGIIDIGGLNAQGRVYNMGSPLPELDMDSELGTHTLSRNIADRLNAEDKDARYTSDQVESLIERNFNRKLPIKNEKDKLAIVKIEKYMEQHLRSILLECKKNKWNLEYMDIVFSGGGSQLMRGYISQKGFEVSENCLEDNVRGFHDMAVNYFYMKGVKQNG